MIIIIEKIKKICFNISTLFGLGEKFYGGFTATIIALPVVLLLDFVSKLIPEQYFFWLLLNLLLFSFTIILLALSFVTDKDKTTIVLNNMVGMIIVFIGIPLKIKLIITGFVSFHIIAFLAPFIVYRLFKYRVENIPSYISTLFVSIIYGTIANVFLRFIFWLAR